MRLHTEYIFLPSSSALFAAPRETWDPEKGDLITWVKEDLTFRCCTLHNWGRGDNGLSIYLMEEMCKFCLGRQNSCGQLPFYLKEAWWFCPWCFISGTVTDVANGITRKKSLQQLSRSWHFILGFFVCLQAGKPAALLSFGCCSQPSSFQTPSFNSTSSSLAGYVFLVVQECLQLLLMAEKWDISRVLAVI